MLDQEGWVSHFWILFSNFTPGAGHGSDGEHDEEDGSKEKIVAQIFCKLVRSVLSCLALFPPSSQFFLVLTSGLLPSKLFVRLQMLRSKAATGRVSRSEMNA